MPTSKRGVVTASLKQCSKCHVAQPIGNFYPYWCNTKKRIRVMSRCVQCDKKYKPSHKFRVRRSNKKYPRKERNRQLISKMIRIGEISRPNDCGKCGEVGFIYAHHPDHRIAKLVVWLCSRCHTAEHRRAA